MGLLTDLMPFLFAAGGTIEQNRAADQANQFNMENVETQLGVIDALQRWASDFSGRSQGEIYSLLTGGLAGSQEQLNALTQNVLYGTPMRPSTERQQTIGFYGTDREAPQNTGKTDIESDPLGVADAAGELGVSTSGNGLWIGGRPAQNNEREGDPLGVAQFIEDTNATGSGKVDTYTPMEIGSSEGIEGGADPDPIGGYLGRYLSGMAQLDRLGETARRNVREQFDTVSGQAQQSMVDRGLANTTIGPQLQAYIGGQEANAMTDVEETLAAQRLGWGSQLSGDFLNAQTQLGLSGIDLGRQNTMTLADFLTDSYMTDLNTRLGLDQSRLGILGSLMTEGPPRAYWSDALGDAFNTWRQGELIEDQIDAATSSSNWLPSLVGTGMQVAGNLGGAGIIASALGD